MADYEDYLHSPAEAYVPSNQPATTPAPAAPPAETKYEDFSHNPNAAYVPPSRPGVIRLRVTKSDRSDESKDPGISLPGRERWGGESVSEDAAKGVLESYARGVGSGVTLNADDELAGAAALYGHAELMNNYMQAKALGLLDTEGEKKLQDLQEQWKTPSQIYAPARDAVRTANKKSFEEQPGANVLGQLTGGAFVPAGAAAAPGKFLVRTARGAGVGALYGGLAGFNAGEGTQDRLEQGATGAITGGILGGSGNAVLGRRAAPPGVASSTADVMAATDRAGVTPLPVGAATDSAAVHGLTQAGRQLPFVGGMIDESMAGTVNSMNQRVKDEASALAVGSGTATDREHIGEAARASINKFIEDNEQRADSAFGTLRTYFGGDVPTPIPNDHPLVQTLQKIQKEREAAGGEGFQMTDLINVLNLATHPEGATFNGLQRARSELDKYINWNKRNGGFNQGDLKSARGALTDAMRDAIAANAHGDKATALKVFDSVNALYSEVIEQNNQLREFMRGASDERLVDRILSYGSNRTGAGDMGLLTQIKGSLSSEDWKNVTGFALNKMGENNKGEFSPPIFLNRWAAMSDSAKDLMYGPAGTGTRQFIDDIATISTRLNVASKYENKSNTGRALMTGTALLAAFGIGEFNPLEHVRLLAGGYGVAYLLSRPATASTMAKWTTAYNALIKAPSFVTKRAFSVASRNFAAQIGDVYGVKDQVDAIAQFLQPSPEDTRQGQEPGK